MQRIVRPNLCRLKAIRTLAERIGRDLTPDDFGVVLVDLALEFADNEIQSAPNLKLPLLQHAGGRYDGDRGYDFEIAAQALLEFAISSYRTEIEAGIQGVAIEDFCGYIDSAIRLMERADAEPSDAGDRGRALSASAGIRGTA